MSENKPKRPKTGGRQKNNAEGKKIDFRPTEEALQVYRSWTGNKSAKLNKAIINFKEEK